MNHFLKSGLCLLLLTFSFSTYAKKKTKDLEKKEKATRSIASVVEEDKVENKNNLPFPIEDIEYPEGL